MNDIITPMEFDITKKLHGHVRVETRSRWTGRVVDSQEKDNLVTNAVSLVLQTYPWCTYSGMATVFTPIYEKLLGAVMLFDNTLTEQASNIGFPSSAKIVGFAGQDANSSNPYAGSYNANESVFTSNGFTTVWDFLTSQANGTIASLSRTNYRFTWNPAFWFNNGTGYFNYSAGANSANAFASQYEHLGYDDTNKYLFIASRNTKTFNGVNYPASNIYRVKQDLSKITLGNMMPPASQMELVKTLTSSDGSTYGYNFTYDQFDNCFLYASGTTLHIINAANGTHTTKTLTGTSGTYFCVTENYYWRSTGSVIYRISKTNTSNVGTYTIDNSTYIYPSDNDVVFTTGGGSTPMNIVYPDGSAIPIVPGTLNTLAAGARLNGILYSPANYNNSASISLHPSGHYLGTIANLDSPVTKTSSQTMKITYTLTES